MEKCTTIIICHPTTGEHRLLGVGKMILQIRPHHLIILLLMLLQWATVNFKR